MVLRYIARMYGAISFSKAQVHKPWFNNANRIARILYRLSAYRTMGAHMLRNGVSPRHILRTQFPRLDASPRSPLIVTLEFTNHCNLRCVYCSSPVSKRPRGLMDRATFKRTLSGIRTLGVDRIRVVGNGEATLHPEFRYFTRELSRTGRFVSLVTNGQWIHPERTISALLDAPLHLVEVSVDSSTRSGYESSRPGGNFQRLLRNLLELREAIDTCNSQTLVNIRLMIRPSERAIDRKMRAFWSQYANTVTLQPVVERKSQPNVTDMYRPIQFDHGSYPTCSLPFKELQVNWNGDVPLCGLSAQQLPPVGLILGNVMEESLDELWNHSLMAQYRQGHHSRDCRKMEICKGCSGV